MRILFIVFKNTIREGLRKKFFIGLLPLCFLILCLSLLLAQISLTDNGRLTVNFGLASIQLLLVGLAVFFGSGFISEDLDKKLWMILVRPVRPSIFFLGRYLGLCVLLFLALLALSILLIVFFLALSVPIQTSLFYALLGCLFESFLLLAFVLLFSSYSQPFLVSFYVISTFIIGHFVGTIFYFIEKAPGGLSDVLLFFARFIPNLEKVNWKSAVIYQDSIPFTEFGFSSLYILIWIGFILSISFLIMENREYN